jgi:hypothetical protein
MTDNRTKHRNGQTLTQTVEEKKMQEVKRKKIYFKYDFYNCTKCDKRFALSPTITIDWWYGFNIKVEWVCWVLLLEWVKRGKL